jgi:hypothetical protein
VTKILNNHRTLNQGLVLPIKNPKNSQNSGKLYRLLKIPQIFQVMFLSKTWRKKIAEILPASTPKYLSEEILIFRKKL